MAHIEGVSYTNHAYFESPKASFRSDLLGRLLFDSEIIVMIMIVMITMKSLRENKTIITLSYKQIKHAHHHLNHAKLPSISAS